MRIVHTVGSIGERSGGPSRTVTSLCSSIAQLSEAVDLVTGVDRSFDDKLLLPVSRDVNLHLIETYRWGRVQYFPGFAGTIARLAKGADHPAVIHDHGLWAHNNVAAWYAASRCRVPYILSPRGMLGPQALKFKAHKKKPAWLLYQRRIAASASLVVAASDKECENVKALFPKMPVAIVPNGIRLPHTARALESTNESLRSKKNILLFVSRIHPIKNILGLLRAWHALPAEITKAWELLIGGPDEDKHSQEILALVGSLGLHESVKLIGPVDEAEKSAVYQSADVFVLPSFSENFGVVVAEALAHGLPVIASTGTPWKQLPREGCGWWVEPDPRSLATALREAMSSTPELRAAMGARGREFIRNYGWDQIAQDMTEVYRWILGQGPRPDCVHT